MDEELLSFICSEYAKISGCSEVSKETVIAYGTYGRLSQRIEKQYSCRMFRDTIPKTLSELVILVKRNMDYVDIVAEEILNAVEKIVEVRYKKDDELFADISPAQGLTARSRLKEIMFMRYHIKPYRVKLKDAKTAADWAAILCENMNRFKN